MTTIFRSNIIEARSCCRFHAERRRLAKVEGLQSLTSHRPRPSN